MHWQLTAVPTNTLYLMEHSDDVGAGFWLDWKIPYMQLYRFCQFCYWFYGNLLKHWIRIKRSRVSFLPKRTDDQQQRQLRSSTTSVLDIVTGSTPVVGVHSCKGVLQWQESNCLSNKQRRDVNQGWMQTIFYWSNSLTNQCQSCQPPYTTFPNGCEKALVLGLPWQFPRISVRCLNWGQFLLLSVCDHPNDYCWKQCKRMYTSENTSNCQDRRDGFKLMVG